MALRVKVKVKVYSSFREGGRLVSLSVHAFVEKAEDPSRAVRRTKDIPPCRRTIRIKRIYMKPMPLLRRASSTRNPFKLLSDFWFRVATMSAPFSPRYPLYFAILLIFLDVSWAPIVLCGRSHGSDVLHRAK